MLQFTLLGALCMLGTLWLVVRARSVDPRGRRWRSAWSAVYVWSLLSMLTTLAGTTLLSFRLQPTLTVLLAAAGAFGFIEVAARGGAPVQRRDRTQVVAAAGAIGAIGAMTFSQDIPDVLRSDIVVAYTDTDGNGQRADRRPPGAEKYYREIDAKIQRGDRQAARRDRGADRRLQLPVVLPVLRIPGPDVALRQPAGAVRRTRGRHRALGRRCKTADQFIADARQAAVAAADGVPDAPRRRRPTRCGWPPTSTRTSPTSVATTSTLDAALFDDPRFTVSDDRAVRAGHPEARTLMAIETPPAGPITIYPRGQRRGANHRTARLVAIVAGLLGAALALATPFLPVKQTTAQLNWPQNGVLHSVNAPLIGYVATDLTITRPVPARPRGWPARRTPARPCCCRRCPSRRPRPSTAAC